MYYIGSFIPRNGCNPHHNSVRQTLYDQNFVDDCWNSVCLGNIFPYIHKQKKARILKQDALIIYIYIYALSQHVMCIFCSVDFCKHLQSHKIYFFKRIRILLIFLSVLILIAHPCPNTEALKRCCIFFSYA